MGVNNSVLLETLAGGLNIIKLYFVVIINFGNDLICQNGFSLLVLNSFILCQYA